MRYFSIRKNVILYVFLTLFIAITCGFFVLNPIWSANSPPFSIIRIYPAITAPVDGPYYLENAIFGYQWKTENPLSLWFHPLMSALITILPKLLPANYWFWIISIIFSVGCLLLTYKLICIYANKDKFHPAYLLLVLIIPGGLSIATGNPEMPLLFFNLSLLLSVIKYHKWWLTITMGLCAILTKPNALYMIGVLLVYIVFGLRRRNAIIIKQAILGIFSILAGWIFWMTYVGLHTGDIGSYWYARSLARNYVAGNWINYFIELARSFLYTENIRDRIRYTSALLIPIVNFWMINKVNFMDESHKYAVAAGNLIMLGMTLFLGNPNKVIVYTLTIPGYLCVFILAVQNWLSEIKLYKKLFYTIKILPIFAYCLFMLLIFIVGTPLGWYY